jgi:hypothetical protein
MARNLASFIVTSFVIIVLIAVGHTMFGAELGQPCNDFVLSCRATRGMFTINGCVHVGARPEESFCSYPCTREEECPAEWTCDAASAYATVSSAVEDVQRVCRPPR